MVRFTERSLRSVSGGAKSLRLVSIQLASLALRIALQVSRERRASGTASRFASLTAGCPAPIRCFIACCFPIVHDRIVGIVIRVADAPSLRVRQGSRFCAQRHCFTQGNPPLAFSNFRQNRLRLKQPFPGRTPSAFSAESRTACEARRPCFCYGIPDWSSITRSFTRVKAPAGNLLSLIQEV